MSDEIRELLKRVDEDALGTRCLTMAEVTLCLRELKRLTSERTYSHAEMLANQAAALREAAEAIADVPYAATTKEYVKAILALTTDQLALDRHDAKLRKTISNEGSEREPCGHFKANLVGDDYGHFTCDACRHDAELLAELDSLKQQWNALQDYIHKTDFETRPAEIAELKAQTAVMLEKAATHAAVFHQGEWYVACVCGWKSDKCNEYSFYPKFKEHMLSVIPADYAAALAERDKKIHYEGSCWMLDSIRASLQGYPDHGGDIEVMKEVDRIVREAVRTDRENLCSWLAGDPNWPEGKIVAENILTMTAEENALLAAHRAAAGAPKEKK